jgi:hypothetical protein
MTNWDVYKSERVDGVCHRDFPGWQLAPECDAWTFRRESDGVLSHHKADTPFGFWEAACEASMKLWDRLFPAPVAADQAEDAYHRVAVAMNEGQR